MIQNPEDQSRARQETAHRIAAIAASSSGDVDRLLEGIVRRLLREGVRVRGFTQRTSGNGGPEDDLFIEQVESGRQTKISQCLGKAATGCKADAHAIALSSASVEDELNAAVDLLVINRFGRCESEGGGFRSAIEKACMNDVPVLTAVRPKYLEAWQQFAGDNATLLRDSHASVLRWWRMLDYFPHGKQSKAEHRAGGMKNRRGITDRASLANSGSV